jgi:hypothetical protein
VQTIDKLNQKTQTIGQEFLEYIDESKRWRTNLIEAIYQSSLDSEENHVRSGPLVGPPDSVGNRSLVSKFIDSLYFKHVTDRHERIAEAYKETFKWLYCPPDEGVHPWGDFYRIIARTARIPGRTDSKAKILDLVSRWLREKSTQPWLIMVDKLDNVELPPPSQEPSISSQLVTKACKCP